MGDVNSEDKPVAMDTNEDDQNVLQLPISNGPSVEELRTQAYSKDVGDAAANCYDSFLFWRIAPLNVDVPTVMAAYGDNGITASVNNLSLSETTLIESVRQFSSATAEGMFAYDVKVASKICLNI